MWAATFARNHLSRTSVWSVICICCIRPKSILPVFIATQHARIRKFLTLICWAMEVANHSHAVSAAKISHANTTWIGIYYTQVVTNRAKKTKQHVMCAANCLAEPTICVNISGRTSDNRRANVIISVRIAKNHSMALHCSSKRPIFTTFVIRLDFYWSFLW